MSIGLVLSGGTITGGAKSRVVGGGVIQNFWFDVGTAYTNPRVLVPSNTVQTTIEDTVYEQVTGPLLGTDYIVPVSIPPGRKHIEPISRESSNPAVIVPDPSDDQKWLYVGTGAATITIESPTRTYTKSLTTSTSGPGFTSTVVGFEAGSLRKHVKDFVEGKIATASGPSTALKLYTVRDHATPSYTRNSSVWTGALEALTCIPVWNSSSGGTQRGGTLISPRHIIFARHYQIAPGATIRFVAMDGTMVTRTVTATQSFPLAVGYYPDITIGVLDSDVPSTIKFAKVAPSDWMSKLPSPLADERRIPALTLDQESKALITDLGGIVGVPMPETGSSAMYTFFMVPYNTASYYGYYESKVSGDSGQPAFLIVNNELVILTVWTQGGPGSGTSITGLKSEINSAMTTLGGGYQLTEANWSGFNSY